MVESPKLVLHLFQLVQRCEAKGDWSVVQSPQMKRNYINETALLRQISWKMLTTDVDAIQQLRTSGISCWNCCVDICPLHFWVLTCYLRWLHFTTLLLRRLCGVTASPLREGDHGLHLPTYFGSFSPRPFGERVQTLRLAPLLRLGSWKMLHTDVEAALYLQTSGDSC